MWSAVIPDPNRCSTGLLVKYCDTTHNWRLLNPHPLSIIAPVAVPTRTCCRFSGSCASSHGARPISRQTPATGKNNRRSSLVCAHLHLDSQIHGFSAPVALHIPFLRSLKTLPACVLSHCMAIASLARASPTVSTHNPSRHHAESLLVPVIPFVPFSFTPTVCRNTVQ
jgi:hypothetical protein